jgi:lipopolysaccharide export system protein LptA
MNNCFDIKKTFATALLVLPGILTFCQTAFSLPDDDQQEVAIEGGSLELYPDQGLWIIRENAEGLAHIKQGSMEIFGSEIRLEIVDGELNKANATGTPARFQQQPAVDQAIVHLSGHTLDYDNGTRMLNIDGDAKYSQARDSLNGLHIDYNLDTREVNASGQVQIKILPNRPADQP